MGQEVANLKSFCRSYWAVPLVFVSGQLADLAVTIYSLDRLNVETNPLVDSLGGLTSPLTLSLKFIFPIMGMGAAAALSPRVARHIWAFLGLTCWMVALWNLWDVASRHVSPLSNFWYYCITVLACGNAALSLLIVGTFLWGRLDKIRKPLPEDKSSCW